MKTSLVFAVLLIILLIAWLAIHYGGDWLLKGGG